MPVVTATAPPAPSYARGVPESRRQIIVAGLTRRHALTEPRKQMLDELLAQAEQDMFMLSDDGTTPQIVTANVSQAGQLPGVGTRSGNDYFVIGMGRIELADDHAIFRPSDGGEPTRVYSPESAGATAPPAATPPVVAPPFAIKSVTINRGTVLPSIVGAVLSELLAAMLIIAGILVLRDSPSGRRVHVIWAAIKIPVAIYTALVYVLMMNSMFSQMAFPAAMMSTMAIAGAVLQAAFALAYPITLLFVLRIRSIREYYQGMVQHVT